MIGNSNDETNIPHKLLTNTKVSRLCNAFGNNSANKKLSKTTLCKMIQLERFLVHF